MNRYLSAFLFGATIFLLQLFLVAEPQLSMLSPKSSALGMQAFFSGTSSLHMLTVLGAYVLLGVAAHAAPMLITAKVYSDLKSRGNTHWRRLLSRRGSFSLSLVGTLMLLIIANNALFPASLTFPSSNLLLIQRASPLLVFGLPLIYTGAIVYWFVGVASFRIKALGLTGLMLGLVAWVVPKGAPPSGLALDSAPNLIVIGVDSLRPDHIALDDYVDGPTPTLDAFVSNSVRFERAYTPQARTFVAYMSMLSGQYPTRHKVRENLYPSTLFDKNVSVAHRLKRRGYTTVFAMDEARFANFDEGFGFDAVVSPPPGTMDFLVGGLLDTVGTNLLQMIPGAARLLPHVAGNRAANSTYVPRLHSDKLARAIADADPSKPLFFVSHFCMPHVPYASGASHQPEPPASIADSPNNYRAALGIADRQVQRLLADLRANGRLENAIVVVLSDHGEGLGMAKDRWHLTNIDGKIERPSPHGHGYPALDAAQARILLSLQRFRDGSPVWRPQTVTAPASLVDVVPTLLATASLQYALGDFDGVALLQPNGNPKSLKRRAVFLESGISGRSLRKAHVVAGEVANEFNYLYHVVEGQRFELSPEELPEQLRGKQRAMVLGHYGLSSWPMKETGEGCWLKLELSTRRAQCLPLNTRDIVVREYAPLLCRHFARDSEFQEQWCAPVAHPPPLR